MVSSKMLALATAVLATAVASSPVSIAGGNKVKAGEQKYCKTVIINDESEQNVSIENRFVTKDAETKAKEDNGKTKGNIIKASEIQRFNSTVEFDKDTFVNYVPGIGAVVTKSGYQEAPTLMRFLYSYNFKEGTKKEAAYIDVGIYEQCTVRGSDQWPNLDEVAYFDMPDVHD